MCHNLLKPCGIAPVDRSTKLCDGKALGVGVVKCVSQLEPPTRCFTHNFLACVCVEMLKTTPERLGPVVTLGWSRWALVLSILFGPCVPCHKARTKQTCLRIRMGSAASLQRCSAIGCTHTCPDLATGYQAHTLYPSTSCLPSPSVKRMCVIAKACSVASVLHRQQIPGRIHPETNSRPCTECFSRELI